MRRAKWLDLVEVRRWLTLRCDLCGHRFRWIGDARQATGSRDGKVWHRYCQGYIMATATADERLQVLDLALSVTGVSAYKLRPIAEMRAPDETQRVAASNRVWRVARDLESKDSGS